MKTPTQVAIEILNRFYEGIDPRNETPNTFKLKLVAVLGRAIEEDRRAIFEESFGPEDRVKGDRLANKVEVANVCICMGYCMCGQEPIKEALAEYRGSFPCTPLK